MHRFGVKQSLGDTVHDVDSAVVSLLHSRMTAVDVGAAFCLAGCDYAPSHYGLRHEHFIESFSTSQKELKDLKAPVREDVEKSNLFICLVYLYKHSRTRLLTRS